MNKEDGFFQRKALYGKQRFLVTLDTVCDTSEEKLSPPPPSFRASLRMRGLRRVQPLPTETKQKVSSIYFIFFIKYSRKTFSSNRSKWIPKNAELYADSKSEEKIEKKCTYVQKPILKN